MMGLRKTAVQVVSEILEAQYKALLGGDLDALSRMAPELEKAFDRLRREKGAKEDIARVKEASARNARLLLAAQAGVSSARASLTSARGAELTTYGAGGESLPGVPAPSRTTVRR